MIGADFAYKIQRKARQLYHHEQFSCLNCKDRPGMDNVEFVAVQFAYNKKKRMYPLCKDCYDSMTIDERINYFKELWNPDYSEMDWETAKGNLIENMEQENYSLVSI